MRQYLDLLDRILVEGVEKRDRTGTGTLSIFGHMMRFDLREGFPLLTTKKLFTKGIFGELIWFLRGDTNVHWLQERGIHIWDEWAGEDGTIGKAYGYQLGVKYKFKQGEMDQVDNILWLLEHDKYSRRIMANMYNFADLSEMNLEPCAYSMTFNVKGDTLNAILNQRSQDILTANNWNVVQYALLLMMFAQVSGLKAGELIHVISDAHIYDRHVDIVKELIERPQYPAPKVTLNPEVKDFYEFTVDDLIVKDYQKNPQMKNIPVAI